jgi:hypothetical protein
MSNKFTINLVRSRNAKDCERALRQAYGLLLDTPCSSKVTAPSVDFDGETREAGWWVSSKNDDFCILPQGKETPIETMKKNNNTTPS